MHKKISLMFRQTTRQWLKIRSKILRQKACRIRIQTAATGKTSTVKTKPTLKDKNLNVSSTNQSFSINQSPHASKNWYEQLQIIPISFLKGNKAFDTYALIDPGSQCSFVLDAISEYLELPSESQQSVPLQFLNTENNMTLSKINEQVTINP